MNKRTGFITAGAVVGALAAGSIAVAANIGILNAADSGPIGDLPATIETVAPTVPQVVDIYVEDPTTGAGVPTSAPGAGADVQEFLVEHAGSVTVGRTSEGVTLGDVVAEDGWQWTSDGASRDSFDVTFTGTSATYVFHAASGPDGTIEASVDQPIVKVVRVPAESQPAPVGTTAADDDRDGDEHDDDHDDGDHDDHDHHHEEHEHEGGDDDD